MLIWWIDSRRTGSVIDPAMRGTFEHGEGPFFGVDIVGDRTVQTRFRWTDITDASARWEQACFSDDGGTPGRSTGSWNGAAQANFE